jgi:hypothetical protein
LLSKLNSKEEGQKIQKAQSKCKKKSKSHKKEQKLQETVKKDTNDIKYRHRRKYIQKTIVKNYSSEDLKAIFGNLTE